MLARVFKRLKIDLLLSHRIKYDVQLRKEIIVHNVTANEYVVG